MAAILRQIQKRRLTAEVALVFSDQAKAAGLEIAKKAGYQTKSFSPQDFSSSKEYHSNLAKLLKEKKVDWVICAGYMRILKNPMLEAFKNRIVNIHPSLLPAFPGLKAQRQALEYGVKFTGCTVHFVDEGVDTGSIIAQSVVEIKKNDNEASLSKRILKAEHDLYWRTLKKNYSDISEITGLSVKEIKAYEKVEFFFQKKLAETRIRGYITYMNKIYRLFGSSASVMRNSIIYLMLLFFALSCQQLQDGESCGTDDVPIEAEALADCLAPGESFFSLEQTSPEPNTSVDTSSVRVEGTYSLFETDTELELASITAGDREVAIDAENYTWSFELDLELGENTVEVTAEDSRGATTSITVRINRLEPGVLLLEQTFPFANADINASSVRVEGRYELVEGAAISSITAESESVTIDAANQTWGFDFPLVVGMNTIEVIGTDSESRTARITVLVNRLDPGVLSLQQTSPAMGTDTLASSVRVEGSYELLLGTTIASITAESESVTIDAANQTWSFDFPLVVGMNAIEVIVTDSDGGTASVTVMVNRLEPEVFSLKQTFPNFNANIDAASVTIEGSYSLEAGSTLSSITADNGANVTIDTANKRWSLNLSLSQGLNSVEITAQDSLSATKRVTAEVNRISHVILRLPIGLALNSTGDTAYVLDTYPSSVVRIDRNTGARSIISSSSIGTGVDFTGFRGISLNSTGDKIYLTQDSADNTIVNSAVVEVDVSTGNRVITSNASTGTGAAGYYHGIAVNSAGTFAYVADSDSNAVARVDLATGNRTPGPIVIGFPPFVTPSGVVLNSAGNNLYIIDHGFLTLYSYAVQTNGTLSSPSIVSSTNTDPAYNVSRGTGPDFVLPVDLTLNTSGSTAYVADLGSSGRDSTLSSVDLSNGNRSVVSNSSRGTGINMRYPASIALNSAGDGVHILDQYLGVIFDVDLATGDRSVLLNPSTGGGSPFAKPSGIALNHAGDIAYVANQNLRAVFRVDLATGERTIISSPQVGQGIDFKLLDGIALHPSENRVYVIDGILNAILSVDLNTGNRELVSGGNSPQRGAGDRFRNSRGISLTSTGNTAYIVCDDVNGRESVFRIDLNTGNRTKTSQFSNGNLRGIALHPTRNNEVYVIQRFSGSNADLIRLDVNTNNGVAVSAGFITSLGPGIKYPTGIVLNSAGDTAYITDRELGKVFSVNLSTGARAILSDSSTGAGVDLINPLGLALSRADDTIYVVDEAIFGISVSRGDRFVISD